MEREVRYCTTRDGVRIAYFVRGSGPPFVLIGTWAVDSGARVPLYDRIARFCTVIHFHPRGQGLSNRDVADISLEARCLDLEAVLDSVGGGPARIINIDQFASMIAMAFAARHPDRVERMVLISAVASMPRRIVTRIDDLVRAFPNDHRSVLESYVRSITAWEVTDEVARQWVQDIEDSMHNQFAEHWREVSLWDVRSLIPAVTAPTLLTYSRPNKEHPDRIGDDALEQGREIVSLLPQGRMVIVDELSEVWQAGTSFFMELESAQMQATVASTVGHPNDQIDRHSATAIILIVDIVDSTAITERMGDAAFREKSRELDAALRTLIADCGGIVIDAKTLGDGVLATFTAASQAIDAAMALESAASAAELQLHVGLHAGDVIREEGNVFGGAVNIAARISALSAPGEILASDVVRALARTSTGVGFEDRGEHALKGISEPQRVFAVKHAP